MKKAVMLACLAVVSVWAAAQDRDVISTRRSTQPDPEQPRNGGLTFTNSDGQRYSLEELASELKNLRSAVDQAMPVIAAFNQTHAGGATNESLSLGGAITEVLGALGKEKRADGSSSRSETNVAAVLEGLLGTNAPGQLDTDEKTLRQLVTLERSLKPVEEALQKLNVAASPASSVPYSTRQDEPLTPTGRDEQGRTEEQ